MNKFFVAMISLIFAGSVYAYDFGVSATWTPESQLSTASAEVSVGNLLAGVDVDLQPIAVAVTAGFFQEVWDPEGSTIYAVARAGLPVYEDSAFVVGQAYMTAGLMLIPDTDSAGAVSFEAGFTSTLADFSLTQIPGMYARVGVVF